MAGTDTDLITSTVANLETSISAYENVKNDKGIPKTFHESGLRQQLIKAVLETANTQLIACSLARDAAMTECSIKAKVSASIFKFVAEASESSRFEKYKVAVSKEGQGRTVEVLLVGMMSDLCVVVENNGIQGMEDQVAKLRDAIEALKMMDPSVPQAKSGDTYTHYGSGSQYNAPGGTQNINSGSGNQFSGATFSGPVSF